MKSTLKMIVVFVAMIIPSLLFARETGWINVTAVGGQVQTMFFELSEAVGNDLGCPGTRVLIPAGTFDSEAQKRFYAALLTASATGKKMRFAISGCNGAYPTMISSDYWFLQS
jgi:hypothetical protein